MRRIAFTALILVAVCFSVAPARAATLTDQALATLRRHDQDVNGFSFIVVGDTRHWERFQQPETFRQIVREANALGVAFVIDAGDLLSTGYADEPDMRRMWDGFIEVVNTAQVPFFPVVGNHDVANDMHERLWLEYAGPIWYSFDFGGCHFIIMNSDQAGHISAISPEQLEWLRQDLEQTNARHIFVILHKPLFQNPALWRPVHDLLRRYPTRALFAGHAHIYRQFPELDGIRYYISGGGGAEIGDDPLAGQFHHYMLVSVRGGEVYETVVRPGAVLPVDILTAGTPEQQAYLVNRLDYKQLPRLGAVLADTLSGGDPGHAVQGLAEMARSDDANARPLALAAMERLSGEALIAPLRALMAQADEGLRASAVRAIGNIGGPAAVEALRGALSDPAPAVRERAGQMLELAGAYHPLGAELVAAVPVVWRAALDAANAGEAAGWHREGFDDSDWAQVRTNRMWYEQQGALYGARATHAWGRVTFTVDEQWRGRRIVLRVGALDEGGAIYLNGVKLLDRPASSNSWREPFEIDVTRSLRFGERNLLAVNAFAETTLGGLWKPVSLYAAPR